jgi:hypothetical protein
MQFIESSFNSLYNSTVAAFPLTTKRQHSTQTIEISNVSFTPFLGFKTLYCKCLAQNEGRENNCIILFKNVNYHKNKDAKGLIEIADLTKNKYFLEYLSKENTDMLVRCSCKDWFWRGCHFLKIDHSLYGKDRKPYEALYNPGSANPKKMPILCKHLIRFSEFLSPLSM